MKNMVYEKGLNPSDAYASDFLKSPNESHQGLARLQIFGEDHPPHVLPDFCAA